MLSHVNKHLVLFQNASFESLRPQQFKLFLEIGIWTVFQAQFFPIV